MSWLSELQSRWQMAKGKKLPSSDLMAVVSTSESDLAAAVSKRDRLQTAFDEEYVELHAAGNEVAIKRHRKAIAEAEAVVAELAEGLKRCRHALGQAQQREEAEVLAARWRDVDRRRMAIEDAGQEIEATMDMLASQLRSFLAEWVDLRAALPEAPRALDHALWHDQVLARHVQLQLLGKTGGLLCRGNSLLSLYELNQGPNFKRRVREALQLTLSARPKDSPEPPRAA